MKIIKQTKISQNLYKIEYKNKTIVWLVDKNTNNKRMRKIFKTKSEALDFISNYKKVHKADLTTFALMSDSQINDILDALKMLPNGKTLSESVKKAWDFDVTADLQHMIDEFISIKETKFTIGNLKKKELILIKGKLTAFKNNFDNFKDLSIKGLIGFLKNRGKNKTVSNWKGVLHDFFAYCVRKEVLNTNPIDKIAQDDLIMTESTHKIGIISLNTTKAFMAYLEAKYPQYCRFYALALFAGVRVAEIPRMKDGYFRYEEKKITFPAEIGKIKKAWTLEDLPDNLWHWLEKYKNTPIKRPSDYVRTNTFKEFNLPFNFARHSFATYHLSLYYDPQRTSRITRNGEQMLKDHYWGALVEKDIAKAYFEILPK